MQENGECFWTVFVEYDLINLEPKGIKNKTDLSDLSEEEKEIYEK